uniref:Uncharacterized protein n=1 Tax=Avena sativa TaxID=4498 RepID=A0ACD5XVS7_AVESA
MPATGNLVKLFNVWEIQLFVLLSFTLQVFLFFSGSLRQRGTSIFLRLCIWSAYVGADFIAVYTIGLVSRYHDTSIERHIRGEKQALAFFWAPFLLIHLGGQDTITAFAMEDNNLWLRHLLNLVVQVVLAAYVFWKSIGTHSLELLVSGIFVFVVGIIKYLERTWSLYCGSFKSLESLASHRYKKVDGINIDRVDYIEESIGYGYDDIVCIALRSMPSIHDLFSGRSTPIVEPRLAAKKMIKIVSIVLNVMYADLYTKAGVFRTQKGIILRCISQMSIVVAFALFHANDKQRYSKVDIAITYALFTGGIFLEICAVFISMMSPWTWAWLKDKKCSRLARLSWYIFSCHIGWPEKKQSQPKAMGQYILLSWVTGSGQVRTWNQRVMAMVNWFADLVYIKRKKIFWIAKILGTEYVDVDMMTMECVAHEINVLKEEFLSNNRREWNMLELVNLVLSDDVGLGIVMLHFLTEKQLSKYYPHYCTDVEANTWDMIKVCRKLSNYMMYLLVNHPSMLPLNFSAEELAEISQIPEFVKVYEYGSELQPTKEVLQELVYIWARLLIYAAGKSRPEMHAAELNSGGELITFVWLILALNKLGDSQHRRILLSNTDLRYSVVETAFAFPPANPI